MPTQKIDPKVIFASDAPAIDKPPVFSDKTKGWDVARANDGRPEIKQMNKMQQDTDLKILWLNENAVLPYDSSIDYPDGVVALKDGSLKQLSSGSWVEFLDDFADKDAVKRGIANRYDSSLTYNLGERVVLTSGDIVKSAIDDNANDPNANMTGWVKTNAASQIFDESGLSQQELNNGLESIADLLAIPYPKTGNRVCVKSYHAGTNKGGGVFVYKSSLSATNDGIVVFNGWVRVFSSLDVSPLWAGAAGDGLTNDTVAIQKTIEFCLSTKLSLISNTQKYLVDQTILIPRNFDSTFKAPKKINLDFGNSEFILVNDTSLFESGYYNNGVLVSSYGQPVESQNSFEIKLSNFTATTQNGSYPESYLIRIQDWHQGCVLSDVSTHVFKNFLQSRQNFYMDFFRLNASYSGGGRAGTRFQFTGDHNLCTVRKLVGVNSEVGYHFTNGAVTALTFHENSLEGMQVGVKFSGTVFDVDFSGCYIEAIDDVAVKFETYVEGFTVRNNYINFVAHPNMYFMEYAPVPGLNITINSDNKFQGMSGDSKIIKNKEDATGIGIVIEKANNGSANINSLLVDNTVFGKNIKIEQKLYFTDYIGVVNNTYAVGNYSGKYSNGFNAPHGFEWVNQSSGSLRLQTAILNSQTQRIYVNIAVNHGGSTSIIAGEFIGGFATSKFFEFKDTGYILSTVLALSVVAGKVEITGAFAGNITQVVGEVRLI